LATGFALFATVLFSGCTNGGFTSTSGRQQKTPVRPTAFSEATDFLGDAIKAAREAKLARVRDNKETETEQPAKSLAELLTESAQDSE
jgi:hypothetical protein